MIRNRDPQSKCRPRPVDDGQQRGYSRQHSSNSRLRIASRWNHAQASNHIHLNSSRNPAAQQRLRSNQSDYKQLRLESPLQLANEPSQKRQNIHSASQPLQFRSQRPASSYQHSQQYKNHASEFQNSPSYDSLLACMKDQLESAIQTYSKRFAQELQRNNQQLARLERRNRDTDRILSQRQSQIVRLQQLVARSQKHKPNNHNSEYSKSFEYITGRMRDIDLKLRIITDNIHSKQPQAITLDKVNSKISRLSQQFIKFQRNKFEKLKSKLSVFFQNSETVCSKLEQKVEEIKLDLSKANRETLVLNQKFDRLQTMEIKVESIQLDLKAISPIQFEQERQQIQNMGNQVKKLKYSIESFETQNINYHKQIQRKISELNKLIKHAQQSILQYENRNIELQKLKKVISNKILQIESQVESNRNINKDESYNYCNKNQTNNLETQITNEYESSVQQDDYYDFVSLPLNHHRSEQTILTQKETIDQMRSQNDEDEIIDDSNPKIERLIEVISLGNQPFPLLCSIDQTGYLKYKETGAYIFDKDGYLFELGESDVCDAVRRKVIALE